MMSPLEDASLDFYNFWDLSPAARSTFQFSIALMKFTTYSDIVNWITMTRKIRRTPTHNKRKHWIAVSTLLCLVSSVYCDLHHWRSNQRPQIRNSTTEPTVHIAHK